MPRSCPICRHEKHDEIDAALVRGEAYRSIAKHHGLPEGSMWRHRSHVLARVAAEVQARKAARAEALADEAEAREQRESIHVDDLLRQMNDQLHVLRGLQARMVRIVLADEAAGKMNFAAVREAREDGRAIREAIELLGRLIGQLQTGHTLNIVTILGSESWQVIVSELRAAVEPFPPEVSTAIAGALARLGQRLGSGQGSPTPALAGSARG